MESGVRRKWKEQEYKETIYLLSYPSFNGSEHPLLLRTKTIQQQGKKSKKLKTGRQSLVTGGTIIDN